MPTWVKCTTLQEDKGQRAISTADHGVPFPADGWRFAGATFDPTALYRLSAVLEWLAAELSMPPWYTHMPSHCKRNSWRRWRIIRWVRSSPSA